MSDCQQARVQFQPSLCPALLDRDGALTACVISQPTQCIKTGDRHKLKDVFPISYGSPLVTIDPAEKDGQDGQGEEVEDQGGDYAQRKRRKTLSREPTAALRVGVVFCGRQVCSVAVLYFGNISIRIFSNNLCLLFKKYSYTRLPVDMTSLPVCEKQFCGENKWIFMTKFG